MNTTVWKFRSRMAAIGFLLIAGTLFMPAARAADNETIVVKNVHFEAAGRLVVISYDLQGPADRAYKIKVTMRRKENSSYSYSPVALTGDQGEGSFAGTNKKITWDFFREFPQGFEGEDFYFTIRAELVPQKSNTWLYIAGGAAVAGGAAAAILLSGSKSNTNGGGSGTGDYPAPFGRPGSY